MGCRKLSYYENATLLRAVRGGKLNALQKEQVDCYPFGAVLPGRDYNSAWIPEVLLRDVYLPPFRAALNAGATGYLTKDAGREIFALETISLSIGHSMFPEDGSDADRLLSEADRRMYIAKQKEKLSVVGPRGFAFEPTGAW